MKQKLLKLMCLLCVSMIGMSAWGQELTTAYTLTPTSGSNNSYAGNCDITINGITWNLTGNSTLQPWRIGGKSLTNTDRTLYSKTAIDDDIVKISVTHGAASSITVNSFSLGVYSDADFKVEVETQTKTFAANSTIDFTPSPGKSWDGCYYKFTYNVTVSGNSNKFIEFSEAVFYKESGGGATTCAAPTFSVAEGAYTTAQSVELSTTTDGATIYYTTNGDEPTTSSSVYSSAISVSTTTTIKAIAVKNGMDNSSVASATYTIVTFDHAGTQADPYTVADAHTAIDANINKTGVYATGIVSEIVTAYSSEYKNITFNFVTTSGDTKFLEAYRCGGVDVADVQVGDIVVVSGDLTKHGSIYEFGQGCTLVSLTHTQAGYKPAMPIAIVSELSGTNYAMTTSVSGGIASATEVTIRNGYVVAPDDPSSIVWFMSNKAGDAYTIANASDEYINNNKTDLSLANNQQEWTLNASNEFLNSDRGFVYRTSAGGFKSYATSNAGTSGYGSVGKKYSIAYTLTVSASGYATYYNSKYAYTIPAGLTGYAITAAAGDQLTTTEYAAGTVVPAGEALVLKGAQGNYDLIFTTTTNPVLATNLLKGSDAAAETTGGAKYYMLSYDETGANVGFYWGEDNGAAFTNGAHKAYLALPADTPVKGFRFDFDATAINSINAETTNGAIYNLQGQRVNSLQKGINIVGGKKVLVK